MEKCIRSLVVLLTLAAPSTANAEERWLVSAGGGLMQAVSEPQLQLFGPGASGTAGFYRSLMPWMALGTRFTATVIGNNNSLPAAANVAAPGTGGMYTFTLSTRLRPFASSEVAARATGLWIEGGGGVGRTGNLLRPAVEAGIGYGINVGPVVVSPTIRYQQLIEQDNLLSDADGRFVSMGIELTFTDGLDFVPARGPVFISLHPLDMDYDGLADIHDQCPYMAEDFDGFRDEDGCPEHDVDGDGFADAADDCPTEPETENGVNDYDGCPDTGVLEVVNGVIVIDEKILFPYGSYRIRKAGLAKLREMAQADDGQESWVGLVVEGHADIRGTKGFNQRLSLRRARAVQKALKRYGMRLPIDAVGFGETRPLDRRRHSRNRRVEIRVNEERPVDTENAVRQMSLVEAGGL